MYCSSKTQFIPCCDDERCAFVETVTTSTLVSRLYRSCIVHSLCLFRIFLRYTSANRIARCFHHQPSTKYPQLMQAIFTSCLRAEISRKLPTRSGVGRSKTDTPVVYEKTSWS